MDRRTLIAILLIIVVFWLSNELIWKNRKPESEQGLPESSQETMAQEESEPYSLPVTSEEIKEKEPEVIKTEPVPDNIEIDENIKLENENLILIFSNQGGVLKSIILKNYFLEDKITPVNLIPTGTQNMNLEMTTIEGNRINLGARIFSFELYPEHKQISFQQSFNGNTVKKIFTLKEDNQIILQIEYNGNSQITNYNLGFESGIADTEEYLKHKSRDYKAISMVGNELKKVQLSKLKEKKEYTGNVDWAAVKSKYFTLAIVPSELVSIKNLLIYDAGGSPAINMTTHVNDNIFAHEYELYFGPLVYDKIRNFHPGLENLVEMGPKIIQWISKIFLSFLKILNSLIPNWGICIIIFAFLLKILLYPLTHKSFESSHKMQKIQPKLKELQAKYKNDPRTLNVEMKKLYQEHGVSPLGGCLPMLLQMPILFALYPILRYSIDLRQTSFLWLPDLSEPDGTLILPIAMAIFMFIQQKLMAPSKKTSENMDEKQQAAMQSQKMMMYIMPVFMFFIFKSLASGLVLYWTVFSIMSTIQQHFIKKSFIKE